MEASGSVVPISYAQPSVGQAPVEWTYSVTRILAGLQSHGCSHTSNGWFSHISTQNLGKSSSQIVIAETGARAPDSLPGSALVP